MKKCTCLTLLCYLAFSPHLFSQMETPTVIPPSPEVAALGKYGDIPVSYYTGVPNISIPLFEATSGSLSVPVSISYHASGIRVSEEASWVGLGWTLQAGGVISRSIMGKDDYDGGYFNGLAEFAFTSSYPDLYGNLGDFLEQDCAISLPDSSYALNPNDLDPGSLQDFQPDVYHFNFGGYSGKFVLKRDWAVVLESPDRLQIIPDHPSSTNDYIDTWKIITPDGIAYFFEDLETYNSDIQTGVRTSWFLSRIESPQGDEISFAYLSGTKANALATISSNYSFFAYYIGADISNCETHNSGTSQLVGSTRQYDTPILSSITSDIGEIRFMSNHTTRDTEDLVGGYTLEEVQLFVKDLKGNLPSSPSKRFVLGHTYFVGSGNESFGSDLYTSGQLNKRLKLTSIQEYAGSESSPPYTFVYDESVSLPAKTSFAQDHWGYYNGQLNNSVFYPRYTGPVGPNQNTIYSIPGANRDANPATVRAFSLTQITYPTGGTTEFIYESNTYKSIPDPSSSSLGRRMNKTFPDQNSSWQSYTFEVDANVSTGNVPYENIRISYICDGPCDPQIPQYAVEARIKDPSGNYVVNSSFQGCMANCTICNLCETYLTLALEPGIYTIEVILDDPRIYAIDIGVKWNIISGSSSPSGPQFTYGGGQRIAEMINSGGPDNPATHQKFIYHYGETHNGSTSTFSNGRIISPPTYIRESVQHGVSSIGNITVYNTCYFGHLSASSSTPLSGSGSTTIGYDSVAVLYGKNASNDYGIGGKTIHVFHNRPDTLLHYNYKRPPGLPNVPHIDDAGRLNGKPKAEIVYVYKNGSFSPVSKKEYTYLPKSEMREMVLGVYVESPEFASAGSVIMLPGFPDISCRYYSYFYPALVSDWTYLSEVTDIRYDQDDSHSFSTTTTYIYDLDKLLLRSQTSSNSDGSISESRMKYPEDYDHLVSLGSNLNIQDLVDFNIVASPLETQSWVGDGSSMEIAGGSIQVYENFGTSNDPLIFPHKIYLFESNAPVSPSTFTEMLNSEGEYEAIIPDPTFYKERMEYDYSQQGKFIELTPTQGTPTAYIWGHGDLLAIAKIDNASSDEVAYSSFEESQVNSDGNWTISVPNSAWISNGKTGLNALKMTNSSAKIETAISQSGEYILSFWYKGRPKVIASGSTHNLPSKSEWTYWEKQFSLNSGQTIKIKRNSGSPQIDEVRLYPADAFMTTICYDSQLRIHTQTDANNQSMTYHYDHFGRMEYVQDQDGNYVQHIDYHIKD